jgi:hypothetical protein
MISPTAGGSKRNTTIAVPSGQGIKLTKEDIQRIKEGNIEVVQHEK